MHTPTNSRTSRSFGLLWATSLAFVAAGGTGELECTPTEKLCIDEGEEACVGFDDPDFGCASRQCTPCNLANATPRCSPTGNCVIAACQTGFKDCFSGDGENGGCETDIRISVDHCGACGEACNPVANAEISCGSAACFIRLCDSGFKDCNKTYDDGCEVDVMTSNDHCGECGTPCAGTCVDGECT